MDECTCSIETLMKHGCQCGQIQRERGEPGPFTFDSTLEQERGKFEYPWFGKQHPAQDVFTDTGFHLLESTQAMKDTIDFLRVDPELLAALQSDEPTIVG